MVRTRARLEKRQPIVYVLTVKSSERERHSKVYVQQHSQQVKVWCQCMEKGEWGFCDHLFRVFSNEASLVNQQDVMKRNIIITLIKGTPLQYVFERYAKARIELLRSYRHVMIHKRALDKFVLPSPIK